jgi:hypothetical protein
MSLNNVRPRMTDSKTKKKFNFLLSNLLIKIGLIYVLIAVLNENCFNTSFTGTLKMGTGSFPETENIYTLTPSVCPRRFYTQHTNHVVK